MKKRAPSNTTSRPVGARSAKRVEKPASTARNQPAPTLRAGPSPAAKQNKKVATSRDLPAAKPKIEKSTGAQPAAATASDRRVSGSKNSKAAARPAKPGPSATALDPIQFPEERSRTVKTHLSAKQLRQFKTLLLQKRAELAGDVRRLTSEALHRNDNGSSDHSTMPIHMADLGSDNWEQDFTLGLIANEEAVVRDIDEALERIENRTYGICMATEKPISVARLLAKPWAKYCIEYARLREEGRAP